MSAEFREAIMNNNMWRTQDNEFVKLQDMTDSHLQNAWAYMLRNAFKHGGAIAALRKIPYFKTDLSIEAELDNRIIKFFAASNALSQLLPEMKRRNFSIDRSGMKELAELRSELVEPPASDYDDIWAYDIGSLFGN
jgi:hypothetical protein